MPRQTQVEMFIQTLATILEDERERQSARLRRQNKAQAERFVQAFWAKFESARRPSKWSLQSNHTAQLAARQSREEETCTFSYMTRPHISQE